MCLLISSYVHTHTLAKQWSSQAPMLSKSQASKDTCAHADRHMFTHRTHVHIRTQSITHCVASAPPAVPGSIFWFGFACCFGLGRPGSDPKLTLLALALNRPVLFLTLRFSNLKFKP